MSSQQTGVVLEYWAAVRLAELVEDHLADEVDDFDGPLTAIQEADLDLWHRLQLGAEGGEAR